jgi:hypothetical protein
MNVLKNLFMMMAMILAAVISGMVVGWAFCKVALIP